MLKVNEQDQMLLAQEADEHVFNIIHMIYHAKSYEGASKDYEFSRTSMLEHWSAGMADTQSTLGDPRWTVQAAAAYALGHRGNLRAVSALLAALDNENSRDVYQGIYDQHAFPEWPGGSNQAAPADLGVLPANAGDIPEHGAVPDCGNRWRLKQPLRKRKRTSITQP